MRTLVRVLAIGFGAVILLLAMAAAIGVNNARSTARSAADLVNDQLVITRLLDEMGREQEVLNNAFYRLSRIPEIVDRERVLADLDQTDRNIDELARNARNGPEHDVWQRLDQVCTIFRLRRGAFLTGKRCRRPPHGTYFLFTKKRPT